MEKINLKNFSFKKKSGKLIKYNKKKIAIISIIIIAIISGISIGIYFAVRSPSNKFVPNTPKVSWENARNRVQNMEEEEALGIYIHNSALEDDDAAIYRKNDDGAWDKQNNTGPFSNYRRNSQRMSWISLSASSDEDLEKNVSKFFFGNNKSAPESLGNESSGVNLEQIGEDSFNQDWENADGDSPDGNVSLITYSDWNDDDKYYKTSIAEQPIQGATWLYFYEGELKFVNIGLDIEAVEAANVTEEYWEDAESKLYNE